MDILIDTQILSYYFKKVEPKVHNHNLKISSITANEFLLAQPKNLKNPEYYVLHPAKYSLILDLENDFSIRDHFKNPKAAKNGSRRTDQIIIDFGNQFPSYCEYGSSAIAKIINDKVIDLYKLSILHLSKPKQKYLIKRLTYILRVSASQTLLTGGF